MLASLTAMLAPRGSALEVIEPIPYLRCSRGGVAVGITKPDPGAFDFAFMKGVTLA